MGLFTTRASTGETQRAEKPTCTQRALKCRSLGFWQQAPVLPTNETGLKEMPAGAASNTASGVGTDAGQWLHEDNILSWEVRASVQTRRRIAASSHGWRMRRLFSGHNMSVVLSPHENTRVQMQPSRANCDVPTGTLSRAGSSLLCDGSLLT